MYKLILCGGIFVICSLENMRRKEVIDIQTGERLGYIDDVQMNIEKSGIVALVILGRNRLFGLLGKEENIIIPCSEIEVIGDDVLLIRHSADNQLLNSTKARRNPIKSLFE